MGRTPKERANGTKMTASEQLESEAQGLGQIMTVFPYEPCRNNFLCIYYT